MKKLVYIVMPTLIALMLIVAGYTLWRYLGAAPPGEGKTVTIYDGQKNLLATVQTDTDIYELENWAYIEAVLTEAAEILAAQEGCAYEQARETLFSREYQIYTAYDPAAFVALKTVGARWGDTCNTACALTDLKGNLLAVHSTDTEGAFTNYALARRSPYSSFKALSVYTPAVEKGLITWSTLYEDSPYKQLNGADWPANATGVYSQKETTVYEALRTSLNTVAVKCLADVGVSESIKFLQDGLGIPLKEEEYVVDTYGEEEVIGSIALGYLETGITPVEMAGYYQMFANGGKYIPPKAVTSITLTDGAVLYTRKTEARQVISPGTADLMNKLLQGVVASGGTGYRAKCSTVEVAGKTGTGDDYGDNWFVGVLPGYSLAVWHGQQETNQAAEMFASAAGILYGSDPYLNRNFVTHQNLYQLAYCVHSGKPVGSGCSAIDLGYYISKQTLPVCDTCSKK